MPAAQRYRRWSVPRISTCSALLSSLFLIGKIFLLCDLNIYAKRLALVVPFAAMLLDVPSVYYQEHPLLCLCRCVLRHPDGYFHEIPNPAKPLPDVVFSVENAQ